MKPVPRPGILDVAAYVGGEHSLPGVNRVIRLASNENPLGPSEKAMAAYRDLASELHRYPDGGAAALRRALGAAYKIDPARIVCGAGSDELIGLLVRAYAGVGDEVLYSRHGFLMYAISARTVGAVPVAAPERDMHADIDALLAHVTPRTKIVFIANPNNPTGTWLPAGEIARLRRHLPENVLLVIDAAYAEYMVEPDYEPGIKLVESHENVVMTRTFSKIHGLASLRIGWAYCAPAIADILHRVRGPFNVSAPALAAAEAALADIAHVEHSRTHNAKWRQWFLEKLTALGFEAWPSGGNFLLVRFPDVDEAVRHLNARGVIPRRMASYGLPDCLRITIGTGEDMEAVVEALAGLKSGQR
ncbi:MAG: histidinol-phosphate transaminase [Dongiaceae bacterium]